MDIKKWKPFFFLFFLLSSGSIISTQIGSYFSHKKDIELKDTNELKSGNSDLVDNIFLFEAPSDNWTFFNLNLEKNYNYYISGQVVTPHNCSMNISIYDPDLKEYNIFYRILDYYSQSINTFEVPIGIAISGNYIINFTVIAQYNLNIYIKIEKGEKVLYDKIPFQEFGDLLLYNTTRFHDGKPITHYVLFKEDYMYKFYIGRVSPFADKKDNTTQIFAALNYSIIDPLGIHYVIYFNETMKDINFIYGFSFGVYRQGIYTTNISIKCKINYVNIGYAIFEDYKKGSGPVQNITDTDPINETSGTDKIFYIPKEWSLGTIIFIGSLLGITSLIVIRYRKKNKVSLNMK